MLQMLFACVCDIGALALVGMFLVLPIEDDF
jgi:hypothetical protein